MIFCKCGCDFPVNTGRSYLSGHNVRCYSWNKGFTKKTSSSVAQQANKIRKNPERSKTIQLCACGCGEMANPGNKFINGHNRKGCDPHNKGKGEFLTPEARARVTAINIGKPAWNKGLTDIYSEETLLKMRKPKSEQGRLNIKEAANRPEIKEDRSKRTKEYMSRPEVIKEREEYNSRPETKEMYSKRMKNNWQNPEYVEKQRISQHISPNKPESSLDNTLTNRFPKEYKYTGDFSVTIGGKCPDFVNINGQKKIIELYGDYWHRNDNPQDRIDLFAQYGYDTLIIWEHELKDVEKLHAKLDEFHHRENPYSKHKE